VRYVLLLAFCLSAQAQLTKDRAGRVVAANFRSAWISDDDLPELKKYPDLTQLDFSHTRITDLGFQQLKGLKSVTSLNLFYAENIGDGAMAAIKDWTKLRELNLHGTKITDAGISLLSHVPLESIDVGFSLFTDNGMDRLAAIPTLRRIAVGGNKITDVGLSALRTLPHLTALDLSGKQRTDSGLWAATVTDRGVDSLALFKELRDLNLHGARITDAGAGRLGELSQLESLDLGDTPLSSRGLGFLSRLQNLQRLSLAQDSKVDDQLIPVLAQLKKLRWLDLKGTKVTPAAAARLTGVTVLIN
jgi:Leucine-rich repeat (LRR) protein